MFLQNIDLRLFEKNLLLFTYITFLRLTVAYQPKLNKYKRTVKFKSDPKGLFFGLSMEETDYHYINKQFHIFHGI